MCRLIESICVLDGQLRNLDYHQKRMDHARFRLFGAKSSIDLRKHINFSPKQQVGKFKCRVLYGKKIEQIQILPYQIRLLKSLQLVEANTLEYDFKYEDRSAFQQLKSSVTNEVIIVKNGAVTDTSYSNLVFYDGENWITPTTYLLNGTMRQSLIDLGEILERFIAPDDLKRFSGFKPINAMMDLEEGPTYEIGLIENL